MENRLNKDAVNVLNSIDNHDGCTNKVWHQGKWQFITRGIYRELRYHVYLERHAAVPTWSSPIKARLL